MRLQLAYVLARMGDEDGARSQFRRASAAGLPPEVARAVDRFRPALQSSRRLGFGLEVSVAPDSNINRANASSTANIGSTVLDLSPDAQAQSGVGFSTALQGFWRPRLNERANLLFTANAKADLYGKSRFNEVIMSAGAGPELLLGRSRVRPAGLVGARWFGGKLYSESYGVTLNWLRQLDRTSEVQLDLTTIQSNYRINPAITGFATSGALRYERALSPRLYGRILARVDRQDARDPAYASWSMGGELLLSRDLGKFSIYGRAGYYRTRGDAAFSLPPQRRRDTLTDLEAGVILKTLAIGGFAPVIRVHRTANRSPVFFYDFHRTRLEFGATHDF